MPSRRVPAYRRHKPSGQAVVTLDDHDFYLGKWNSAASRHEYDRLTGEWLANGRRLPATLDERTTSIAVLLAAYWKHARSYYVKNGKPTDHQHAIRAALRRLRLRYARKAVTEVGPLALKALQEQMIEEGRARKYINDQMACIKRVFKWGVAQELVPPEVFHALAAVPGLAKGRSQAKEMDPIRPVSEIDFEATIPFLSPVLQAMVQFQRLTGCRPMEVRLIRPCDIDRSKDVWCYRPEEHKTEHHGHERHIFIGPKAQTIIKPWLLRPHDSFCFSPRESVKDEGTGLTAADQQGRVGQSRPNARKQFYTKDSYCRAITRACKRADVPQWSPNQLRHAAATEIRSRFGLEAAQTVLGHRNADVTQVYAERDLATAARVMGEVG
jgi:integrase